MLDKDLRFATVSAALTVALAAVTKFCFANIPKNEPFFWAFACFAVLTAMSGSAIPARYCQSKLGINVDDNLWQRGCAVVALVMVAIGAVAMGFGAYAKI